MSIKPCQIQYLGTTFLVKFAGVIWSCNLSLEGKKQVPVLKQSTVWWIICNSVAH